MLSLSWERPHLFSFHFPAVSFIVCNAFYHTPQCLWSAFPYSLLSLCVCVCVHVQWGWNPRDLSMLHPQHLPDWFSNTNPNPHP